jgi:type VI secretion system secreted protein Hcp
MIFVKIADGRVPGDKSIKTKGYEGKDGWFIAESFGFGVEREMKESGEKGGTEDINIGVGELQECTISKSMDMASPHLCQFAINGNSPGAAEIHFVEVAGGSGDADAVPTCYLAYKLHRCFIKSWSTSGDADDRPTEEVAFYYNKIAFRYASSPDGKVWEQSEAMKWDNTRQQQWSDGVPTFNFKEKAGGWDISG